MKKRTGRLQTLADKHDQSQNRKDEYDNWNSDRDINGALQKPVQWILQWLFSQSDKSEAAIFEMRDRVPKFFFEIAQDQQTNAKLVANLDDVLVCIGEKREFQKDDLSDSAFSNDLLDFVRPAEDGNTGPG